MNDRISNRYFNIKGMMVCNNNINTKFSCFFYCIKCLDSIIYSNNQRITLLSHLFYASYIKSITICKTIWNMIAYFYTSFMKRLDKNSCGKNTITIIISINTDFFIILYCLFNTFKCFIRFFKQRKIMIYKMRIHKGFKLFLI